MFRSIKQWCIGALSTTMLLGATTAYAVDGGALFKQKCATCHNPHKDGTGPKLFEVRKRWADGGAKEGSLYKWVANWSAAAASDPYAAKVAGYKPTQMSQFPELAGKDKDIEAILKWVDEQPVPPVSTGVSTDPSMEGEMEEEEGLSWIWIILGVVFVTIIMAVGGVRRQLGNINKETQGIKTNDDKSYVQEFKSWAWKYKRYVGIVSLVLVIGLIVRFFLTLYSIGVVENYQPSQPIEFPHAIHTGKNGINCAYCHNSVYKSKSASLPTVNVCMNCHKQIKGNTPEQIAQISKIYDAAGWDGNQYTGKTKEIVWNKVHVLPDHVFFNHSQHTVVGGVDCKQCHGDMTKQEEAVKVQPVSELNKIEGNIPLTRATLTMGWCIECHAEKEISSGSVDNKGGGYYMEIHNRLLKDKKLYGKYLEDKKVTVKELGGWECAKCHY